MLVDEAIAGLEGIPGDDLGRRPSGEPDLDPVVPVVRPQEQRLLETGRGKVGVERGQDSRETAYRGLEEAALKPLDCAAREGALPAVRVGDDAATR